ncbi:MAG: Alanyl-tRNA editing protein AlaX-M [Promethearchaeota archaeon]|nr:MAG: Alanyl-tRNA editing protein AlaX-M [Candidatus Lokiarchaeota archaeon]
MTEALYLDNAYLKEWNATIESVKDGKYIVLDKTAFYPKGGGQPYDKGTISKEGETYNVEYVGKFSGKISHEVDKDGLKKGDQVKCQLDWERRYNLMKMHTAAHILSNIIYNRFDAKITGNQLGVDKTRMDFSMEEYVPEKYQKVIEKANQIIEKDLPVSVYYISREDIKEHPELNRLTVGLPKNIKRIRVVKIGNIDEQADGGTHVNHLGEIGKIKLLKTDNKGKDNRRIYFSLKNQ